MFTNLFFGLKQAAVPVSLREYLTLLEAMEKQVAIWDVEEFYFLARAALVKDERNIDKFDRVFAEVFKGLESVAGGGTDEVAQQDIPEEWLRKLAEKHLSEEDKAQIEALRLIADGDRHTAAAAKLGISESALKARLSSARVRLGARTTAEALKKAREFRLL